MVFKDSPGNVVQEQYRRKDANKRELLQSSDSPAHAHTQEEVYLVPRSVKGETKEGGRRGTGTKEASSWDEVSVHGVCGQDNLLPERD